MKQPDKKSRITVGGVEYIWSVRTWPSWCWNFEDFNGLILEIVLIEDKRRPLIVEFPMERKSGRPKPPKQMPPIPSEKITHIIEQALELGWNPNSRGQPFLMEVDFHGN